MNIEQILKVLRNERECIKRQTGSNGTLMLDGLMGNCDRNCAKCDLCLPSTEILEVYDFLINGYEMLQNKDAESYTIKCKKPLSRYEIGCILGEQLSGTETFTVDIQPLHDNVKAVILGESTKPRCTNGEKIEEMTGRKPFIDDFGSPYMIFSKKWWNSEYKESEEETT